MTSNVIAEAEDGYRVLFALAELDSGFLDSQVLVADTMDGAAIGAKQGPIRLVAPYEKTPRPLGKNAEINHRRWSRGVKAEPVERKGPARDSRAGRFPQLS